jgi:hypothetical protein
MWESFGGDTLLLGFQDYILDLLQQPLGCLDAGVGLGEACVVGGVLLEVPLDVVPLELREEAFDILLVLELGGVRGGDLDFAHLGVEFRDVEEVAAASAVLGSLRACPSRVCFKSYSLLQDPIAPLLLSEQSFQGLSRS